MRIRVLFFGVIRDITGLREDLLEVPDGSRVQGVFEHYANQFPRLREISASLVLALNQHFSDPGAALSEGDEVAFLPPVSGGTGFSARGFVQEIADEAGHFFALTRSAIDTHWLVSRLQRPDDGAVVTFEGVTRNNTKGRATRFLDYECYEPMAIRVMAELGREIAAKYQTGRIGIVHRLGKVEIAEASVVIVACSPHRKAAFDAAFEAINRLKKTVPIWKKEYFADGEVWVEGEWDESVLRAGS